MALLFIFLALLIRSRIDSGCIFDPATLEAGFDTFGFAGNECHVILDGSAQFGFRAHRHAVRRGFYPAPGAVGLTILAETDV